MGNQSIMMTWKYMDYTNDQLAQIGRDALAKKITTSAKWKNYNLRMKWINDQYKKFAIENEFELPKMPDELK